MASLNVRRTIGKIEVEKLQGNLTKVSLLGPANAIWNDSTDWTSSIAAKWEEQTTLARSNACWGVSSKYSMITNQLELMYWFESPNDAMLFKLMMNNYQ